MKYDEMVTKIRDGKKVRRPAWGKDQCAWLEDFVMLHNTPHWPEQKKKPGTSGYSYICEEKDAIAADWCVIE